MTRPGADHEVDVREIADLLAWARRLSEARHHADPADRVAFRAAKTDLFARLAHPHDENDHIDEPTTKDIR